MKTFKSILGLALITLLSFTSCQTETDEEFGENPNTNSANSTATANYLRSASADGSSDDFLDDNACTTLLFPFTAVVNGTVVSVTSEAGLESALEIVNQFSTDDDEVVLQFPVTVMLSNHTEVVVTSQGQFDDLQEQCENAEALGEDAISCLEINYPISVLTFNANAEQTGSVVFESEQQFFAFIDNLEEDDFYSLSFPFTIEFSNGTTATINSDDDFEDAIIECELVEDEEEEAEEQAEEIEDILQEGAFRVNSFVEASVELATDYADFTLEFTEQEVVRAVDTVNALAQDLEGDYEIEAELDVFINMEFENSVLFEALNQTWEVTSFTSTTVMLTSTANASTTLELIRI